MKLTWYGHSAFKMEIAGASILIDPFLTGNPKFPENLTVDQVAEGVTHVLLTHGHDDHIGDSLDICKKTGAQLTANYEICMWANGKGVENINPMNSGGFLDVGPFKVGLTVAHHSSASSVDGDGFKYMGNPHGPDRGGAERAGALSHGRHGHLFRHGPGQRDLRAQGRDRACR